MENYQHPVSSIIIILMSFGFKLLVLKYTKKVVNSHNHVINLRWEFRLFFRTIKTIKNKCIIIDFIKSFIACRGNFCSDLVRGGEPIIIG